MNLEYIHALRSTCRQLRFFTGDLSSGQLSRWPSGADLVKASIHKMSVFKGKTDDVESYLP